MTQQLERRTVGEKVSLETREEGATPIIQGYAALFNTETIVYGMFRESIAPGAFKGTLNSDQRVVSLFNHDSNYLLGSTSGGTMRLKEDERGLWMEVDPPDTQVGRDVTESIRRGDITGQSFMFEIRKQEWTFAQNRDEMDSRVIQEVVLYECGPVVFPAYSDTSVGLRSTAEAAYAEARKEWEESKEPEAPVVITKPLAPYLLKLRCLRARQ